MTTFQLPSNRRFIRYVMSIASAGCLSLVFLSEAGAAGGVTDRNATFTPAPLPLQPVGTPFLDPVFKTTLKRVSNKSASGGFETQIYSQLQAFSVDNKYVLLTGSDTYTIRRVSDCSKVTGINSAGWNCPRWHPTRAHTIVHYDSNADTRVRVQYTDVDTLETTTVYTFPAEYQFIRVNQSFDELSRDGRWIAGMLTTSSNTSVIFSLDLQNKTLGAVLPLSGLYTSRCDPDPVYGEVEPDWIGVSPLGRYLVIQWARDNGADNPAGCGGLETYNIRTGAFVGYVYDGHQHGDLGLLPDGETEIFVTYEIYHPSGNLAVGYRLLPGSPAGVSLPNYLLVFTYATGAGHISCQGPPGTALISFGATDASNGTTPFEGEIVLLNTDRSIRRLVHYRSSTCGYWVQPRASMSADGRYVIFASDWATETGVNSCAGGNDLGAGDPYILDCRARDKQQPDLLIKAGAEENTEFAINNVYQEVPAGSQIESLSTSINTPAVYQIRISNDLNIERRYLLKAKESDEANWSVLYQMGTTDITRQLLSSRGWLTPVLAPDQRKTITVTVTPTNGAAVGTGKRVVLKSYLDASDVNARDAVRAMTTVQ